jgi:acetyl-CoA carboxylase beta subunit
MPKKWRLCPSCKTMIFSTNLSSHRCPDKIRAKQEAELDMVIDAELSTWDEDVQKFWKSKDVKFYQWTVENERLEES